MRLFFTVEYDPTTDQTKRSFHFEHQKFVHDVDDSFMLPEKWIDRFIKNKATVFF